MHILLPAMINRAKALIYAKGRDNLDRKNLEELSHAKREENKM